MNTNATQPTIHTPPGARPNAPRHFANTAQALLYSVALCASLLFYTPAKAAESVLHPVKSPDNTEESQSNLSAGFTSSSNHSEADTDDDENINLRLKSMAHMGDVLSKPLPIFGHNLFGQQCNYQHQTRFFNPRYRLAVGDEIDIQMWGAYQLSQKLTVDSQGNIFIPEVGPVKVAGVENQKLNERIENHLKKSFKKGVQFYADLRTAQPVQVYVTGYVNSPGLYDGLSSDSVVHFLCAAKGINLKEGSFRNIDIVREGKKIFNIDLYDFLLKGRIDSFQLHQGDTIVVHQQRYVVTLNGNLKNPYQYEMTQHTRPLSSLMDLANVEPTATYVRIQRNRGVKPSFIYQPINQSKSLPIESGDQVTFTADKEIQQNLITVKGQIRGKHQYIVRHGTTLDKFMKKLHFTDEANPENVQLFRESIAKEQKDALEASLSRLQPQTMRADSLSGEDAKINESRAHMVTQFVSEAKHVKTKGQVVINDPEHWKDIPLENNDVINIPQKTSVITVSGDVVNSISLSDDLNYQLIDYINAAGGFQRTANTDEFLLMRQNGQVFVIKASRWKSRPFPAQGGDQLIILPKETENGMKVTGMMSSIIYQLAIAARVAMRI